MSIDGSLVGNSATVSISIIAPDIRDLDTEETWQTRPAKVLLIRSWKLPEYWGTRQTCINMAEAIGFIIGEYTIPPNLPIMYITDSDNTRTLQWNIYNRNEMTHRSSIRKIKQGIDSAIAGYLEYLTSLWSRSDLLNVQHREIYIRGEEICRIWAENINWNNTNMANCYDTSFSSVSWNEDSSSQVSNTSRS
jgi:hypothetical protein